MNNLLSKLIKVAITAGCIGPGLVHAAPQLEEVIVTATKRGGQNPQDLPLSIQAFSGESLSEAGAVDFKDFFRRVPGLAVFDQGPGDKRYIIRGVNATGAGTVGVYIDEVIITGENAQNGAGLQFDVKLYDLDRVEVLKGPQGTTFGSSSLSGTIRYITNKPQTDGVALTMGGGVRHIKGGGLGYQVDAAANIPLVPDTLALRLSGLYLDNEGFIDNILEDNVNSEETYSGRVALRFLPNDRLTIDLMAMYQDMDLNGRTDFNEVDFEGNLLPELSQAYIVQVPFPDEVTIFNATVEYAEPFGTFTGTASMFERDTVFNDDASFALFALSGGQFPLFGSARSVFRQAKERELSSYEFRFSSAWDSDIQMLAGLFFQSEDRFVRVSIPTTDERGRIEENPDLYLDRTVDTSIEETAAFVELSYDIGERLNITAGLRWADIKVEEQAAALINLVGTPGPGVAAPLSFSENNTFGKLNLSYNIDKDMLVYAQWAQGFRPGGTNDQTASSLVGAEIPEGFGSDSVDNYEFGLKSSWYNQRLILNASAYLIDWDDIQVRDEVVGGPGGAARFEFRSNGGAAEVIGAEVEMSLHPLDSFRANLAFSYVDAELTEDNPVPATGREGDTLSYVPEITLSIDGEYTRAVPVAFGSDLILGARISYVDNRNTKINNTDPLNLELDSYTLVNLRAGLRGNKWSAMLTVDNLFDDNTVVDTHSVIEGLYPLGFIRQYPRTVLLKLTRDFF